MVLELVYLLFSPPPPHYRSAGTLDDLSVEERVEEAVLAATANTPTEITREQMDMIASSTFDR